MTVQSVPTRLGSNLTVGLPAILLVGGALNGFVVRIIEHWQLITGQSLFFGISPFELITIVVAAYLYFETEKPTQPGFGIAEILFLASLMIPSSTASWISTAAYASFHALRSSSGERTASILFIALALCSIWSSVIMKWVAVPVTTAEASIVWHLLSIIRPDIHLNGNIIGIPGSHQIILMIACSTIYGLPKALLGLMAISLFLGPIHIRNLIKSAIVVVAIYAIANLIRLTIMTWSDQAFQIAHGPVGTNIFDALISIIILITAFTLAQRPENA